MQLSQQNKQLLRSTARCRNNLGGFKRNHKQHIYKKYEFILYTYHNEIIEEEDFSLVCCLFLGFVDISHLKQSTAAHQSSMRDRENLQGQTKTSR